MKRKQYENSKLKKQLADRKAKGVKTVEWKLNYPQKEFVEQLGYTVTPVLYRVKTKRFINIKSLNPLLKNIHYQSKNGKGTIVIRLKKKDIILLEEYGVCYYPYKYEIRLCG